MKEGIHPDYHNVLFVDTATGNEWVTRSTLTSKDTREVDGEKIPVVKLEVSSYSHPFWTGKMREVDSDGKIDRFRRRFGGGKKDGDKKDEEKKKKDGDDNNGGKK